MIDVAPFDRDPPQRCRRPHRRYRPRPGNRIIALPDDARTRPAADMSHEALIRWTSGMPPSKSTFARPSTCCVISVASFGRCDGLRAANPARQGTVSSHARINTVLRGEIYGRALLGIGTSSLLLT